MTSFKRVVHCIGGFVVALSSLTACQPTTPPLTEQEARHMEMLTKKMTPRCFGRYLVDLPEDMVLNTEGLQTIGDVTIDIRPMSSHRFDQILGARTNELENTLMVEEEKFPLLRTTISLPAGSRGLVFDRAESAVSGGRLSRMLELLAWKNGYRILATIRATDTTFPEDANDAIVQRNLKTNVAEKLAQLLNVFHRARGRADDEIPTEQGVCIPNGFISGPPTGEENVGSIYHLKTADDVYFSFDSDSRIRENDTLLDRADAIKPALKARDGKFLRTGHRTANGIKGDELLTTMRGDDNLLKVNPMTHRFTFEANSKIGSGKTPVLIVDFYNGVRKPEPPRSYNEDFPPPITKATLSEAEAIALWDAVIPTLRPRPGAF